MQKKVFNEKKIIQSPKTVVRKFSRGSFFTSPGPLLFDKAVVVLDVGDEGATLFHRVRGSVTLVPKSCAVQWKILVTSQILHFTEQQ